MAETPPSDAGPSDAVPRDAGPRETPLREATLTEQVYERLRASLLTGAFTPDQRMTIRALSASLGVSATPVREALGRLAAEGALDVRAASRSVQVPLLTRAEVNEIYELRILLEGYLSEHCVENMTETALSGIEAALSRYLADVESGDIPAILRSNFEFKFAIFRAARLPAALRIVEGLWLRIGPHLHLMFPRSRDERLTSRNFRAAVGALKARDAAGLKAAMQRDLIEHRLILLDALSRA